MKIDDVCTILYEESTAFRNNAEACDEVIGRIEEATTLEEVENALAFIEDVRGQIDTDLYLLLKQLVSDEILPKFIEKENE